MAVQKYDIRRPESEGGGFEQRYWSPVNSPVFGVDKQIAYIIHRVQDVTEFIRLKQLGSEQHKLTEELQRRAQQMEAEIYLRAHELQEVNKQLIAANEARERLLVKEQQHRTRLQKLALAALAMNSALSIIEVVQVITEQARSIIDAHQSVTSITIGENWTQAINSVSLSDKYAAWRDYDQEPSGSGIYACVCQMNRAMRMTQAELEAHPGWRGFGKEADEHPPMRGWLAAPLTGRDGRNIGLIQLSDKYEGEFTEEDEAMLVQLAQMASVAIENTRLYEAEQSARAQAEAANRLKDEFLAVLSHELRSPLNPILGWTKLLQTRKFDSATIARALETIERNAQLQTRLIEDLLDICRIMRGKISLNISPVNLVNSIEAAVDTMRLAAQAKSIQIQTLLDSNVGLVSGDSNRLQQVVWNLLSNAIKFTPAGGQIEIRLEAIGSQAQIQVRDTGIGISADFLPHVFDYFRQADASITRSHGGLGLGLAIVRHLVEMHGGSIYAESPGVGQGATFTVKLPLVQESREAAKQGSSKAENSAFVPLKNLRVLVVDDEPDIRELLTFTLEHYGAEAMAVASAGEVLAAIEKFRPDVLVSDIGMAEEDGYTLIRKVRALSPERGGDIPAVALTAYAREEDRVQALAAGFQRHITKPIEPGELATVIESLAQRTG